MFCLWFQGQQSAAPLTHHAFFYIQTTLSSYIIITPINVLLVKEGSSVVVGLMMQETSFSQPLIWLWKQIYHLNVCKCIDISKYCHKFNHYKVLNLCKVTKQKNFPVLAAVCQNIYKMFHTWLHPIQVSLLELWKARVWNYFFYESQTEAK